MSDLGSPNPVHCGHHSRTPTESPPDTDKVIQCRAPSYGPQHTATPPLEPPCTKAWETLCSMALGWVLGPRNCH